MNGRDPLEPVAPGQPFGPTAATWNTFIDTARAYRRAKGGRLGGGPLTSAIAPAIEVLVKNRTGVAVPDRGVLVVPVPLILPTDSQPGFRDAVAFRGQKPDGVSTVVITQESLAPGSVGDPTDGAVGRALIMGPTRATINVGDATHGYAVPIDDNVERLASAAMGPIRLLWYDATGGLTGDGKDALVSLLGFDPNDIVDAAAGTGFSGARIYNDADQTIPAYPPGELIVEFDQSLFDTDGYQVGATKLTAPADGYYLIGGQITVDLDGTGELTLAIVLNGVRWLAVQRIASLAQDDPLNVETLWHMTAGDYVELLALTNDLVDRTILTSGGPAGDFQAFSPHFWIARLSGGPGGAGGFSGILGGG